MGDHPLPLAGERPQAGYVALPVPQDVGILQVVLGVYDPGTGLSVGDWVELGEVAE